MLNKIIQKIFTKFTNFKANPYHPLVWVDNPDGEKIKANEAIYTFVAVDINGKPIPVDKIKPESAEEQKRYDGALRRRQLSLVLAGKMKAKDATELMALFS